VLGTIWKFHKLENNNLADTLSVLLDEYYDPPRTLDTPGKFFERKKNRMETGQELTLPITAFSTRVPAHWLRQYFFDAGGGLDSA
jgi:hypothetical protein